MKKLLLVYMTTNLLISCAGPQSQSFMTTSGTKGAQIDCVSDKTECFQKASETCSNGSYQVINSWSNSGGSYKDWLPGPFTWYHMQIMCGPSDGRMPEIPAANAWADSTELNHKEIFEKNKDNLSALKCSGNTETYVYFIGEAPRKETSGKYTEYYYLNDNYFFRARQRIEMLGEFKTSIGWQAIPLYSNLQMRDDEIVFKVRYPEEYLKTNPLDYADSQLMQHLSQQSVTKLDRNTGEHSYSLSFTLKDLETQLIIRREDIWNGVCSVIQDERKF